MLILVGHGSRNAAWRASVERVVQQTQDVLGTQRTVRLAYMDCTPPSLGDLVAEAVRDGITRLEVLPLFLADEGHVERDVRPAVEALRQAHPRTTIALLPAMGQHPAFVNLLYEIATEAEG
jgi:sirohydrochlorin cobaltochelatase